LGGKPKVVKDAGVNAGAAGGDDDDADDDDAAEEDNADAEELEAGEVAAWGEPLRTSAGARRQKARRAAWCGGGSCSGCARGRRRPAGGIDARSRYMGT
jgi:hypothetical protein